MRQGIFCKVSRTGKAVHPAGALLAEEVVYLTSLTVVCEERVRENIIDEGGMTVSGAVQPDSVDISSYSKHNCSQGTRQDRQS
jgi:hypothetical protein